MIQGVVGIDLSVSCTGFARADVADKPVIEHTALTKKKDVKVKTRMERYDIYLGLCYHLIGAIHPLDVIFIEDYAYQAGRRKGGGQSLVTMGEVGATIRILLKDTHAFEPMEVPIGTWKKFLCGRGNLKKDEFKLQVFKKYGLEPKTNDEAVAIAIADFGLCVLRNGPEKGRKFTQYEQQTIDDYRKNHTTELQAIAQTIRLFRKAEVDVDKRQEQTKDLQVRLAKFRMNEFANNS